MAAHSNIVGGSTAKRVIACPGSVKLVQQMPPRPSSRYADEGTLCHTIMEAVLVLDARPGKFVGQTLNDVTVTTELIDRKILPAIAALSEIDPNFDMTYECEAVVGFGDALPGVFGSADLIGRIGSTAIVLDWKFGDGVDVAVEENPQAMFYAAAAMRTPKVAWAFKDVTSIDCIIVQPTADTPVKVWRTTPDRIRAFERQLFAAVKEAMGPDPSMQSGDHCRWCAAKPVCPLLTGAVDRALKTSLQNIDAARLGEMLEQAPMIEEYLASVRALAQHMLEEGVPVPGFKLVQKRATRQWVDVDEAQAALVALVLKEAGLGFEDTELMETKLVSPAQAEKALKKRKIELPDELVVAVSSGTTLAPESDPRPPVLQIGRQLAAALGKIV
jgi:hypothetical protein